MVDWASSDSECISLPEPEEPQVGWIFGHGIHELFWQGEHGDTKLHMTPLMPHILLMTFEVTQVTPAHQGSKTEKIVDANAASL